MQQTGEQIEKRDKKGYSCHDVIGFTITDDSVCFIQDQARHQQNENGRDCQKQSRYFKKEGDETGKKSDQHSRSQEIQHKQEITMCKQGDTRHDNKNQ